MNWKLLLAVTLAGYWTAMFIATHIPAQQLPEMDVSDKVQHFAAYGLLGMLLYSFLWARNFSPLRTSIYVVVIGAVYGALDELLQIPVNRIADLYDWIADVVGILLAVIVMSSIRWQVERRRRLSTC